MGNKILTPQIIANEALMVNISGNPDEMDYNTYKKWRKENI